MVAIGAPENYYKARFTQIYQQVNKEWSEVGTDIDGEATSNLSGVVAMSADGRRVAIDDPDYKGHTCIYKEMDNVWTKVGTDIDGEAGNDL